MPKLFNLAVVGYGYVGRTFHAPLIASTPGLQLHSVVSSKPQQPQADFPGVTVVADLDSALADPALDAVVLATPNHTHAPFALEALAAGKHVLVDKPFALDATQAQQMVDAANAAGRIISVFQNRRWDADFLTVRRLIEEGQLGEVVEFHSHFDRYRPQVRDRWRESDSPGAGLWYDLGPHLLDQAMQLFGMPQGIGADLQRQRDQARSVDYFHVTLHYPRLRVILHAGSLVADGSLRFAVHGTRCRGRVPSWWRARTGWAVARWSAVRYGRRPFTTSAASRRRCMRWTIPRLASRHWRSRSCAGWSRPACIRSWTRSAASITASGCRCACCIRTPTSRWYRYRSSPSWDRRTNLRWAVRWRRCAMTAYW